MKHAAAHMRPLSPINTRFAGFLALWRSLSRQAGRRFWWAVVLLLIISIFEGSSLLMLAPMLRSLGLGGTGDFLGRGGVPALGSDDGTARAALPLLLVVFAALKAVQAGLRAFSANLNLRIQTDFVCFLRERFYRAMMRANWLFLVRQRSAELSQALLSELPMAGASVRQLLTLLSTLLLMLAQVAIAVMLSPSMTLFALAAGVIIGLGVRRMRQRMLAMGQSGYGKRTEMAAAVSEHLAGMKIAKAHGRETLHFAHFQRVMHQIDVHAMQLQGIGAVIGVWLEVGAVLALSLFVYLARDHVGAPELVVLAYVFARLLAHATLIQGAWHQITVALPSFEQTERLRERLIAVAEPSPTEPPQRVTLRDSVRLEKVDFHYDATSPTAALAGVDLVIPSRQVIALCGRSGAGKSTMADVILGLLPPTGGRVLIDGKELAGEQLHRWRQSVGYVPQETFLFHETIRANLLWVQPDSTEAELRAVLRAAAAEEFVDRLPHGLDTVIGDRGVRLSGGERQRIALARALLRRPTLLLLDEATSALDTQNERFVQDAIERLHGELTIVLIAHRLSTVRMADRIVVMESGKVAETGTWDELCQRSHGAFSQFVAAETHR